jgi:hypothetical protein
VLGYSLMEQSTRVLAYEQLRQYRLLGQWQTRLSTPDRPLQIMIAMAEGDEGRLVEYRRWAGIEDAELRDLRQTAGELMRIQQRFEDLPPAASATVLGDLDAFQTVVSMRNREVFDNVRQRVRDLRLRLAGFQDEGLWELVGPRQTELLEAIERIRQGHAQAIAAVARQSGDSSPTAILSSPGHEVMRWLASAGFVMDDQTAAIVGTQAQRLEDIQELRPLMEIPPVRAAVARQLRVHPRQLDLTRVLAWLTRPDRAQWLVSTITEHAPGEAGRLDADRLLALAEADREQTRLQTIVGDTVPHASTGVFDLPTRTLWLVVVSFMVCAIGVINAMMMSVAERFTEIATMKCLGALDGFLLKLFFYEAMIQGLIGGVVGVLLGLGLALGRGLITQGPLMLQAIPVQDIVVAGGLSLLAGGVLGAVAAIGPAWTAARLPPMEAMRVD